MRIIAHLRASVIIRRGESPTPLSPARVSVLRARGGVTPAVTWALALVTLALAAAPAPAPAAAAVQLGVDADITRPRPEGRIDRALVDRTLRAMADAGVEWVRLPVIWGTAEPARKGRYEDAYLADVDYAVSRARRLGIEVLLLAQGTPRWASANAAANDLHWRPADPRNYADFFALLARRYVRLGVHAYEVWNEPNSPIFWPSVPPRAEGSGVVEAARGAAEYTALLRPTYRALRRADPRATVVTGGLTTNDHEYLAALYAAGAKPYFDAVGVHPYVDARAPDAPCPGPAAGPTLRDSFCGLEALRGVMVQPSNGDAAKPIWITELGWSNCPNSWPGCFRRGVSLEAQADYLTRAFDQLNTRYPWVEVVLWYKLRDLREPPFDDPRDWTSNLGLLRADFTPKPAYFAFKRYAESPGSARGQAVAGVGALAGGSV